MKVIAEKLEKFPKEFTFTFTDTASTSGSCHPPLLHVEGRPGPG